MTDVADIVKVPSVPILMTLTAAIITEHGGKENHRGVPPNKLACGAFIPRISGNSLERPAQTCHEFRPVVPDRRRKS
jgi:hypothetical protein